MKTFLRLISLCLAPVLLFVFFNIVLAGASVARLQPGEAAVQSRFEPGGDLPPAGRSALYQGPITIRAITGLTISHTTPAQVNIPVYFTATISSGVPPIAYDWFFGDGTSRLNAGPTISHTYGTAGTYTVNLTAKNVEGTVTQSIMLTVIIQPPTGLTITHSQPVLVNLPTRFTATLAAGASPILYAWSFGDGGRLPPAIQAVVTHTYTVTGAYTAVVTASNAVGHIVQTTSLTVTAEAISGLSISHSNPTQTGTPIHFRATIASGTPLVSYAWSFGDGSPPLFDAGPKVSHTYIATGTYTVLAAAFNGVGSPVTKTIALTIEMGPKFPPNPVYLPLVLKHTAPALPDLVCSLSLQPAHPSAGQPVVIKVRIRNRGTVPADGFWVDLYINPTTVPRPGHLFPWPDVCGSSCPGGIAWGIGDNPLAPGAGRTLVSISEESDPNGYDPAYTFWTGSLPGGTHDLYAYVDSIEDLDGVADGAVHESNETNNLCKILDLVVPPPAGRLEIDAPRPNKNNIPPRPTTP